MDGKEQYLDNIFIERLWRSLKYEEIFLKAYESPGGVASAFMTISPNAPVRGLLRMR